MTSKLVQEINTGHLMPMVGFEFNFLGYPMKQDADTEIGTFRVRGTNVIFNVIDTALKAGYRSIDTAAVYQNESDIGAALQQLLPRYGLTRQDIFITSKLAPEDHRPDRVHSAVQKSLSRLGTTYLDLYLVHWPGAAGIPAEHPDNLKLRRAAWRELVVLCKQGLLRAIGVSNYTVRHIDELLKDCDDVIPAVNQVELHPHFPQQNLISHCQKAGILVQAYSSFGGTGNSNLIEDPVVLGVARNCVRQPAQVLLRWALQQNIAVIPKAVTPKHIVDNFDLDFIISDADMVKLNQISTVKKYAWNPEVVA